MAEKTREQRIIERFISQFTGEIQKAFADTINSITDRVRLAAVIQAIENNDIEAVLRALAVNAPAVRPIDAAIERAVEVGGNAIVATFPASAQASFRFDIRNTRAELWLRNESSRLVTRISDEVRAAVRGALDTRMALGSNPRTTALDIVGRINPATGRRVGGLVGLTGQQASWVGNAAAELASGDPDQLANYLTRERRDARFDPTVQRAIATGERIPAATRQKMIGRYSDSLLQYRGETIARTESLAALNRAQFEAYAQAVDNGVAPKNRTTKEWDSAGNDGRTRDSHLKLDGVKVGFNEAFTSPATGAKMNHPGDASLGAKGEDIIQCRCRLKYHTDWIAAAFD